MAHGFQVSQDAHTVNVLPPVDITGEDHWPGILDGRIWSRNHPSPDRGFRCGAWPGHRSSRNRNRGSWLERRRRRCNRV